MGSRICGGLKTDDQTDVHHFGLLRKPCRLGSIWSWSSEERSCTITNDHERPFGLPDRPYQNCRKASDGNGGLGFQSQKSLSSDRQYVILLFAIVLAVTTAYGSNEKEDGGWTAVLRVKKLTLPRLTRALATPRGLAISRCGGRPKAQMFKLSDAVSLCACMQACG